MTFAERLLAAVVRDPDHREAIVGDLREEHARQLRRLGAAGAARWHLRESAGIAVRYGAARLLRTLVTLPTHAWVRPADVAGMRAWSASSARRATPPRRDPSLA